LHRTDGITELSLEMNADSVLEVGLELAGALAGHSKANSQGLQSDWIFTHQALSKDFAIAAAKVLFESL